MADPVQPNVISLPNAKVGVLKPDNTLTDPWRRAIQALFQAAGGGSGGVSPQIAAIIAQLATLSGQVTALEGEIGSIEADAADAAESADQAAQVAFMGLGQGDAPPSLPPEWAQLVLLGISGGEPPAALTADDIPLLLIGFALGTGATGTNVATPALAPRDGTLSAVRFVTKTADATTDLTFDIRQNGASIFSTLPTVAHGTTPGTVSTFTALTSSPLLVAAGDVFTLNISSGTSTWTGTIQAAPT